MNITKLDEKDNLSLGTNIKFPIKSSRKKKVKDIHTEHLTAYLKEDNYITYTSARDKLLTDTGLLISIPTIKKYINKLKIELNLDHCNKRDKIKVESDNNDQLKLKKKLKEENIKLLKKYLIENDNIGNTEARDKLYLETGIWSSVSSIRLALVELEKEIRQESSSTNSTTKPIKSQYGLKLKPQHIEYLKNLRSKNSSIGGKRAKELLFNEFELEVSAATINKVLLKLSKEANSNSNNEESTDSIEKVRTRAGNYGFKIQELHLECLKRYLVENESIKPGEAQGLLLKETGLEVCNQTIRNYLTELKAQINSDNSSKSTESSSKWNYGLKLKEKHINLLKQYLIEDNTIGSTRANNKLKLDTGLEISIYPVQKALIKIRKELSLSK